MTTGIVKDDRYLAHNLGAGHIEGPERLEVIHAVIERGLPPSCALIEPRPASREELEYIHAPEYVGLISRLAGRRYVELDQDTSMTAGSYEAARLAAGGAIRAADMIMDGEVRNAVALVRPPGHHAERGQALGFCIFNNIAVAAEHLLRRRGLRRILIADWDLHHGNGTQNAFYFRKDVLFFSTHRFPFYPGSGYWNEAGAEAGEGFTVNVPLTAGKGNEDYRFIYRTVLGPIAAAFRPEFILVSAGFDIFAGDPLGGMEVTAEGFGALAAELLTMARDHAQGRILFVLEGGYSPEGLAAGVLQVLAQLSGKAQLPDVAADASLQTRAEIAPVIDVHGRYWPI
jgi:acetoin utilization deacetylase AcuC-like enzyme